MQKIVSRETLEKAITRFETECDRVPPTPEILQDLTEREHKISAAAWRLGFDQGVSKGILSTLQSFLRDFITASEEPEFLTPIIPEG